MNMTSRLHNLASVSTGAARAVYESANSAFHAIFEGEEGELAELSELGNEIGDDLGDENVPEPDAATEENVVADNSVSTDGATPSEGAPEEAPAVPEQQPPEEPAPEAAPENVNAQPQPASISADALIDELKKLKYPEKIREVGQQMKQSAKGKTPNAEDMIKPVGEAISKYMSKKGYAAMQKDDFIRVVKTIIMAATDIGQRAQGEPGQEAPQQ